MNKVTLAIPVYKGRGHICKLLDSIQESYDGNFEIVIRENFSECDIENLLSKYSFPVNYKKHSTNIGFDGNIKSLIDDCQTEYIWFMGCDDSFAGTAPQTILQYLENYQPSAMIVNWSTFHSDGRLLAEKGITYGKSFIANSLDEFAEKLGAQFFLSSMIIKRSLLSETICADYDDPSGFFHWYTFLKVSQFPKICFIEEPLVIHSTSNETYFDHWIDLFFINYPKFVNTYVENKQTRDIFINQNFNFSMTLNILHKRSLLGQLGRPRFKQIFVLLKKYPKFYIYILIPLVLNTNACRFLMFLKNTLKRFEKC